TRAAKAQADAQAIASAARQYQAVFGALPDSIQDLTEARTVSGVSGGPFLARIPDPPTGWSAYQYVKQGDRFTVTSSGGGATVTAPWPDAETAAAGSCLALPRASHHAGARTGGGRWSLRPRRPVWAPRPCLSVATSRSCLSHCSWRAWARAWL